MQFVKFIFFAGFVFLLFIIVVITPPLRLRVSNCTNTLDIIRDVPSITVLFFANSPSIAGLVLFQDTFWPE